MDGRHGHYIGQIHQKTSDTVNVGTMSEKEIRAMTWSEYASENKQCFVKHMVGVIQATRYEPMREVSQWLLYLPEPHDTVYCKTIEEARECAARFGCTIIL